MFFSCHLRGFNKNKNNNNTKKKIKKEITDNINVCQNDLKSF